ncbi:MAG: alpha-amylase family glycosyl hydrolase [Planctomycetota bacterium]
MINRTMKQALVCSAFTLPTSGLLGATVPTTESNPWWHDAVFYEIFVRSFADSREGPLANDGIGDIRGMIDNLDYLNDGDPETTADLGIDAVWLMPIAESPSYHGYDVVDYKQVDQEYGTNADFRAFTDAAHERGIRVIVDLVLNHSADEHPWFVEAASSRDSPKRDWFIWSDTHPGYPGPWNQNVWHNHVRDQSGQLYYGCFYHGMPDLNVRNAELTAELYEIARFWIEDMGVDGFRLDAIKHLIENGAEQENTQDSIDWLEGFNAYCKSLNPDFFTVGEVWSTTDQVARYIPGAVDTAFEFDLAQAIIDGLNSGDAARIVDRIRVVDEAYDTPVATFLTNHDQSRLMTQLGGDVEKAEAAAAILLTLPGVPFIYYGEEIGHTGGKPDPNIRTPMQWDASGKMFSAAEPWRPTQPDAVQINVESQRQSTTSLLAVYRNLIALRQTHEPLQTGAIEAVPTSNQSVLAFERSTASKSMLVVVNTSSQQEVTVVTTNLPYARAVFRNGSFVWESPLLWSGGITRRDRISMHYEHAVPLEPFEYAVFLLDDQREAVFTPIDPQPTHSQRRTIFDHWLRRD